MQRWKVFKANLLPIELKHITVISLFIIIYLSWTYFIVGFREDHKSFLLFIVTMFVIHRYSRTFTYSFIFFILFWIIYDSMRVVPNFTVNDVHISEPYFFEKHLFGINTNNEILTPNEYLKLHAHPFLDLLSGFFYLTWVPVPMALAAYLFTKDKIMLLQFSAAYLFTNLLGFMIYYAYPAAPPWYFEMYGDQKLLDIPGHAAQLLRFDQLVGVPIFENMYTKNANVFAAIPSLHAAYPVVTWYYARKKQLTIAGWLIIIDILGIWFAAVYSNHHYIIDVMLGLACAILGILIFEKLFKKYVFEDLFKKYLTFIDQKIIT